MPRTSWQDLARDDPAGDQAAANEAAQSALQEATAVSPEQTAANAMREAGLPQSLQDVPELQGLLSERSQLEGALRQLTGGGTPSAGDTRDARRFPMESSSSSSSGSRLALKRRDRMDERAREAERRAFEVDNIKGRRLEERAQQRHAELMDRAARRRRAGEDRVAQAAESWDRHRSDLLAARDLAREAALGGRGLVLPGNDTSARVARMAQGLANVLDMVDRMTGERDPGANRPAGRDRGDDAWGQFRDAARDARRWIEDPLGQSEAGRRLRALREELSPPELPDYTGEGDVDVLGARQMRALAALRDRRAEDASPRSDAEDDSPRDRTTDDTSSRRRADDTSSRSRDDDDSSSRSRRTDDSSSRSRRTDDSSSRTRRTDDTSSRRRTDDTSSRRRTDDTSSRSRTDDTSSRSRTDDTSSRRRTDDTSSRSRTDDTSSRSRTDDTSSRRRTDDTSSRRSATTDTDR